MAAPAVRSVDSVTLPRRIETPSEEPVAPPVQTREQLLPVHQLTGENLERLCVRLARLESDVEHCQLYGERGDEQHGIDLYARQHESRGYAVYQCKRVRRFTAASLKLAVKAFLNGRWADSGKRFVICTTANATQRRIADEIERQYALLKKRDCALSVWDAEELSRMLKHYPSVVDDFFGRSWVVAFCGEASTASFRHRLDNRQGIY